MNNPEHKRECYICQKITFNADTFGTWETRLSTQKRGKLIRTGKWYHYKCKG